MHSIFEAAAPLDAAERQKYVQAAAPDAETAEKVLAMLKEMETTIGSDDFPEPAYPTGPASSFSVGLPQDAAFGRFVVTGLVGRGGMGSVYSARDPDLNREVALKVISEKAAGFASEMFIREAQAASALNHPNIVTVHDVIRSGPMVAIAMELITGTPFRHLCGTPQPVAKVARWGAQIAHALEAAHARGIVHRDIKPENLMLRPDGLVKVLDFGLARQAGMDRDGSVAGTLGYMSPEELLQQPITAASDIFSLGIVLYELAAGTNPFRAGATTRLIQSIDMPPLPAQQKDIPRELDQLVRAMLSKSPTERPTASEVASRLEAIAEPRSLLRRTVWIAAVVVTCAVSGAVWIALQTHGAGDKPVLLQSLPLDSEPASETAPAFSPDGSYIVYASDSGSPGIHHIATRRVAGMTQGSGGAEPPRILTSGPQDDTNPVWSRDGANIAFLRTIDSATMQAIVIPAGGGSGRVVANLPGWRPSARKYLTWAPDSDAIVASNRLKAAFALRLYRLPLSGGPAKPLTEGLDAAQDVSPAFSPDGRWLAFLRWEDGATYALWAISQPGGKPKLLVTSPVPITSFAWKPDSRTIVYGGGPMSTGELREVRVDGHDALAPFVLEGQADQITIAPNGARLAYVLQNLDANIWRLPLDGNGQKNSRPPEKLFASSREEMDPAYSPDGKSIAFVSNRSGHWNLWMGNADGTGLREFGAQTLLPFHPAWSPDSREIAFDSGASGKGEIWLVNAIGGPPRRLVAMPGGAQVPSWSRDGKRVLFYTTAKGTRQIWEVPAAGGNPVQLTRGGTYDASESPDGRYLYYGSVLSAGVWRMPLAPRLPDGSLANQDGELIRETLPVTGHRFWALGQGGIYFVDARSSPAVLKFIDLTSRKLTVLATLPKAPAKFTRGLSISPDGQYALYCQDDVDRYEIRVVENFH